MKFESFIYDLLMDGMSLRELVIYIILIYVALRMLFIYVARKYLNKQLPIESGNQREEKIISFHVRILDFPLLAYTFIVLYLLFNGYFQLNIILWYVGLLASIIIVELLTGIVRRMYVSRLKKDRLQVIQEEKKNQEKTHYIDE